MRSYRRPDIHLQEFVDASGSTINYGERWGTDSPPEDSYSVTSNLERFAPLHAVADAMISHLEATYDVVVTSDPAFAKGRGRDRDDVIRAVRVSPNASDASPLTFVFTSFPSVIVQAVASRRGTNEIHSTTSQP